MQLQSLQARVRKLEQRKAVLEEESGRLRDKNSQLIKQNDALQTTRQLHGEKSYLIRVMIDQYFRELEENLGKIGGLTSIEVGSVIGNEMKGILNYIDGLIKKIS